MKQAALRHNGRLGRTATTVGVWLCLAILVLSCSPMKTVKNTGRQIRQMAWSDDAPYKRIGIVPFVNQTRFPQLPLAKTFQQKTAQMMAETCPDLKQAADEAIPDTLPMMENGLVDNLALAVTGRTQGLNAVVAGSVISLGAFARSEGWFWFKNPHYYLQAQVAIDVYDTLTGAKLLYESLSEEVEIDEFQHDAVRAGKIQDVTELEKAMGLLAERAADKICESLGQVPWAGYVIAAGESGLTLSAGADAGLEVGMVFEAFPCQRVYRGNSGQEFLVPGLVQGRIEISAVQAESAEAVLISGTPPAVGDAVRIED